MEGWRRRASAGHGRGGGTLTALLSAPKTASRLSRSPMHPKLSLNAISVRPKQDKRGFRFGHFEDSAEVT